MSNHFDNKIVNKILFFDSQSSIDKLKDLYSNDMQIRIISFDYESHRMLVREQIPHDVSDIFLDRNECLQIQEKVYELTYWFYAKYIIDFLKYREVNLGRLFQDETLNFLVQFLKKFKEIK